jgi:hypothetical protein
VTSTIAKEKKVRLQKKEEFLLFALLERGKNLNPCGWC